MKLILIRHGEMDGEPFICPQSPVSGCLTEEIGVLQAKETANALKGMKFDYAFSSPYGRALQTAEIVLEGRNMDINILLFMHEWLPNLEVDYAESTVAEEIYKRHKDDYAEETWKTELGEGHFEMCSRIIPPFLKELDKLGIHNRMGGFVPEEFAKDISIVVFAHGGSLGILINFLLGVRSFAVSSFTFEHTGVALLEFSERHGIYYPQLVVQALHSIGRQ